MSSEPTQSEMPKTLPRKKQLCKHCRTIVAPNDKIVYEERTYHKSCLIQLNETDQNSTIDKIEDDVSNDQTTSDEHKVILTVTSSPDQECLTADNESSDKFYEVITNDKLSIKSFEEPIDEINFNNNENISSKKNLSTSNALDSQQLKSVSSNLSSLNPFEDENDDEFYETEEKKSECEMNKIEIKISQEKDNKDYPKELNPFGSDDEDLEKIDTQELKQGSKELEKSTSSNPFGDTEDDIVSKDSISNSSKSYVKLYPEELNPFDENDETIEDNRSNHAIPKNYSTSSLGQFNSKSQQPQNQYRSFGNLQPNRNSFNQNYDTLSIRSITPDGKLRSRKKHQAPRPPTDLESKKQNSFVDTSLIKTTNSSPSSAILNHSTIDTTDNEVNYQSSQSLSENENSFVSLTNSEINESKENIRLSANQQQIKKRFKDRPAPRPPLPLIRYVDSIEEIERECNEIGDKLLMNSNCIREIEMKLKNNQTSKEMSKSTIKKLIYEYLNFVETKCQLDKRQIELSYMKCENKLEKDRMQLDNELREMYNKDAKSKTFGDLQYEEDMLQKLIDIVERKNEIEENIIRIDKSDEFDKSVQKICELVDESIVELIVKDFKKHHLNESNIRNDLYGDVDLKKKKKKHEKKGFTLKKLNSKLKLSS